MRSRFLLLSAITMLPSVVASRAARADEGTGFRIQHFEPSERGSDWFALDSLDLRGNMRAAVGVVGDYSYRSLVVYNPDDTIRDSLVRNQLVLHPGVSLVMADRIRVGADLAVLAYGDGHSTTFNGTHWSSTAHDQSFGDLRFGADLRVLGVHGDPFTLALGGQVWAPIGLRDTYTGDDEVRIGPHVAAAGDIGIFTYAARLGYTHYDLRTAAFDTRIGDTFDFAGSAGLRVIDGKLVVGPEVFGNTVTDGDVAFKKGATPIEGLLGAHYQAGDVKFGAGVGTGFTRGIGAPAARVLGSIEWAPSYVPPVEDRDGDGVADKDDACPGAAGVHTDDPSTNGCPLPKPVAAPPPDQDGDGVADAQDACPGVPGPRSDDPKKNGCPADTDSDGVIDAHDACPNEVGQKSADPMTNGCPDRDVDKDGIPNDKDACPDVAGKADPDPKKNGCPMAFVQGKEIKITQQVKFDTGSAVISKGKDSEDLLGAILDVLKTHPEIKKVSVEGHTDNKGAAPYNKKLSADRAASVVKWLTAHGIDAARLTSQGFGSEHPIDTNDTEDGRKNNRRVELQIQN